LGKPASLHATTAFLASNVYAGQHPKPQHWVPTPKGKPYKLKAKFHTKGISLLDFYKKYLLESGLYPSLTNNAKQMTSMFGSTYTCEQMFSTMKFTKSNLRSRISDAHLENVLVLASSDLSPDVEKLSQSQQHQVSH